MYQIKFTDGKTISFTPTESTKLGRGATASVHKVTHAQETFAAKLFTDLKKLDLNKIKSMIALGEQFKQSDEAKFFNLLAWPLALVKKNNAVVGFAMPILDPTEFLGIDSFFDFNLRHNLPSTDFKSVSLLSDLVAKFAEVLAYLHDKNIHVIDLKPQNIKVSKKDLSVHLLDCDGFSITGKTGTKYPAELVSTDYISPEALRKKLSPVSLDEKQDRYALAVLIFQLMNKGIHPFQGILVDASSEANTNDEKALAGLYAYNTFVSNPKIKPHPRSVHNLFPRELNNLFAKAFTHSGSERPSAKQWEKYFAGLAKNKKFKRCAKFPNDATHIHFAGSGCIECYLQGIQTNTQWETVKTKNIPKRKPPKTPQSPKTTTSSSTSTGGDGTAIAWFLVFGLMVLIFIFSNRTERTTSSYSQGSSSSSSSASISSTTPVNVTKALCARATRKDSNGKRQWDLRPKYIADVNNAKSQNLTCGVSPNTRPTVNSNKASTQKVQPASIQNQLANVTDSFLCYQATRKEQNGNIRWDTRTGNLKYVSEAKRRQLTCQTAQSQQNTTMSANRAECSVESINSCNNESLCAKATKTKMFSGKKAWFKRKKYAPFVAEAKRRQLTCGVIPTASKVNSCTTLAPGLCNEKDLCRKATTPSQKFGQWEWETRVSASPYVTEAQKRNLSCNVAIKFR